MPANLNLDTLFRDAVRAIDAGDVVALESMLVAHPFLVRDRLEQPGPWLSDRGAVEGFFNRPYLLWFVAEDPVRNGRLPGNIAEIALTIIAAILRTDADHLQEQLDYTLRLVCWSVVARECGVQIELIDALLDAGASPDGWTVYGGRLEAALADIRRWLHARSRPTGRANAARLLARGESLDDIRVRDAVADDIPALAELHVTTWNATYRTRGPSVSLRARQWTEVFAREPRRDFVVVLEDATGRLIGFAAGKPHVGGFDGQLTKIYLRWEYHGLGLGRRLMEEAARRFLDRGIASFILFAERSNPTIGFYDHMGGERLVDERGTFTGAYGWRDARMLIQ